MMDLKPEKVNDISIEIYPEEKKRRSIIHSRRGSLLFDDQAIDIYKRRGSKLSELSKISRRKSESNIQEPGLEPPIKDDALERKEVV